MLVTFTPNIETFCETVYIYIVITLTSYRLNDLGDSVEQSQHKHLLKHLKQELNGLLHQPLMSKSFSGKYPTKTGKLLLPKQQSE